MRVGYIRVVGAVGEGSICKWMSDLIGGLQSFENELVILIKELRSQRLGEDVSADVESDEAVEVPEEKELILSDSQQFMMPS